VFLPRAPKLAARLQPAEEEAGDVFVEHYHKERNHRGLANDLIVPSADSARDPSVRREEQLGGVLRYYLRAPDSDGFSDTTRSAGSAATVSAIYASTCHVATK
jgi:hypothetical protein